MKFYDCTTAPSPRRVRMFIAEKGLSDQIETIEVNLRDAEQLGDAFRAINPYCTVPVLELDDGSYLTESAVIIRYLEELNPTPPMVGETPLERARIHEVERIADLGVIGSVATIFQNTSPIFAGRVKQPAEAAEGARGRLATARGAVDQKIGDKPCAAGARPTIADCTLYAGVAFAQFAQVDVDPGFGNLLRWFGDFQKRPSAS